MNTKILCASVLALGAVASAQSQLNTVNPFASNNQGSPGGGVYFDVTATAQVLISQIDLNLSSAAGAVGSIDVYSIPGTYLGNESNQAAWTLMGSAPVTANGIDVVSTATFGTPLQLSAGSSGIAICAVGLAHAYTNGTGTNQTYTDGVLTLNLGAAANVCFAGTPFTPRVWNGSIFYNPANGLFPAFTQDVTTGNSPLTVQFTDQSFTSDPAGVVAWLWDFDNDGTPDSQVQNPTHIYTACGTYDVSLTAIDATHGPVTIVKTALIDVDPVVADFSASPLAAFAVSFTDSSAGGVNSWAWDFDNDGTVDSTVQNPVFGYANAGPHTVTLTTSNGCNSDTVVKDVSAVPVLCTTFAGGNGLSVGGNYFDITVTAPNGILITSLDVSAFAAGTGDVVVATAPTTYIGNESNPGAWTEVSRAVGVTVTGGYGTQDNIDVPDFFLAPGTYGMWVATPGGVAYTNGTGTNQAYSNGDLSLSLGAGAGTLGGGGQFTPRVWNGCIYYDNNPAGAYATFAPGCVGSAGTVSSLTAAGPPRINTTFSVAIDNLSAANVAIMVFSVNNQTFNGAPLPVALGQFGMPGCDGHVNPESTSLVLGTGGTGTWNLPIPNIPSFIGTAFYNQALIVDPGFNPLGAVMSDAAGGVVGQ